jgi:CheY-like chemotaxis protein
MREGYRVTAVESGEAALAMTSTDSFDLALLDMMMPGLSGFFEDLGRGDRGLAIV